MEKIPVPPGKRQEQYLSQDTYSDGYFRQLRKIREHTWCNVHPYSLAVWPSHYSDKIREGEWWIRRHNYNAVAVELQVEGCTVYKTGSACEVLHPGELYITVPGSSIRLGNGPGGAGRQVLVVVTGGVVRLLAESLNLSSCRKLPVDREEDRLQLRTLFSRIADLLRDRRHEVAQQNSTAGYTLVCLLGDLCSRIRLEGLPEPLTRAVQIIGNGYGSQFPIGELAAKLGISRATLNILFRQYLGTSPQAYRHRLCMENAIQLVRSGEYSFKEVSEQLGFRNSLYFSTVFRRYTGMSPTEYRRWSAEEAKEEKSETRADSADSPPPFFAGSPDGGESGI